MSDPTTPEVRPAAPTAPGGADSRHWVRRIAAPLFLAIVSLVVGGQLAASNPGALSLIDEWVYYDYLTKIPTQGVVHRGEAVDEPALRYSSCVGVQLVGPMGDDCNRTDLRLEKYPFGGITSADAYTPAYFVVAYASAKALSLVGVDELLVGGRLSGPVWLALGMVLFCALLRRFGVRDSMIVGLGLLFIASPVTYWSSTYLSTDAPIVALSCGLLLLAKLFTDGKLRGWPVVVLSMIAVLFKVTNILAVLVTSAYLLMYYLWGRERGDRLASLLPKNLRTAPDRRFVTIAVAASAMAVLTQVAWLITRALIAVGPLPPQPFVGEYGIDELAEQSVSMILGTLPSSPRFAEFPEFGYPLPAALTTPLTWIGVLGVLGAVIVRPRGADRGVDAARFSVAATAFVGGPLLATAMYLTQDFYFSMPARYGLPIAASFLLMYAITFNRYRWVSFATLGYGLVLCGWAANFAFS